MLSASTFRYYKQNYDMFSQFNRGVSPVKYRLMRTFFLLLYITGISFIFRLIVKPKISSKKLKGENIVNFVFSINQDIIYKALLNLGLSFPTYDFITQGTRQGGLNHFSSRFVSLCSVANAGLVYRELKTAKKDEVLYNNLVRIVKLCGLELIYTILLKNVRVVIQYNDHTPYGVLLQDMAGVCGIKTIYIQHAPVSERFPPLYHDLNVLFSEDSVAKYKIARSSAKKFILFDVRFIAWDAFDQAIGDEVLICPNKLDDFDVVKNFAKALAKKYKVTVRPHPADERDWREGDLYHVSQKTGIWQDIHRARYVVTNESAVILEAIYANRLCYKCAFFSPPIDNYGFLRTGLLLQEYTDPETVIRDIQYQKVTYNRKKIGYFIGEIGDKNQKIKSLKHEILHLGN